jgi:transcriptional regulator with XRE-family HTH domain
MTKEEAIKRITANLTRLMDEQDISIRELARRVDTSHTTIAQTLSGSRLPSPDVLWRMAECLGTEIGDLFRKKS